VTVLAADQDPPHRARIANARFEPTARPLGRRQIGEIGPVRATVITYVNPAVAAALGVLVLAERFTLGMGIGFVLVLAGSVLATRRAAAPAPGSLDASYPGSDSIAG